MQIAIIQLSDIHVAGPTDEILQRAEQIASAALSVSPNPDAYILAITGDVSFSGTAEQFALASSFLREITRFLSIAKKSVFAIFVPGNHDLDLACEPDTRQTLLQTVRTRVDLIDPNGETVRQLLSVQGNFFEFEASMLNSEMRTGADRLAYSHVFAVADGKFRVNCFNTAWVSTDPETPGQMVFPTESANLPSDPTELVIAAFHHPYNWLTPDNARLFRHKVESASDVVLTGHEHKSSVFAKQDANAGTTHYVEGAVLQEHSTQYSAFNVVVIDTTTSEYEAFVCQWNGDLYDQSSSGVHSFVRNRTLSRSTFKNNPAFGKFLDDPGLPILHPHKRGIQLEDLFIYPALARRKPEKKTELYKIVESQEVLEYVRSTPRMLIVGDDTSGKTSFAKTICRELQINGEFVPLLVSGEDFDGFQEKDIQRLIKSSVARQYDDASVDRFTRLDQAKRVLIVDDWHKVKYAAKGRVAIVGHLKVFFGKIICLTNRLYAFDELAETGPVRAVFSDFDLSEIKEFGRLTGKLIERWHTLGREYSVDPRDYHQAVASSEHKISAIVSKGILPTYPIFLIGFLQADASPNPSSQSAGSYGYILEALITARLAETSNRSTDIGLMYTYASRVAYFIFKKDRQFLSPKELSDLHSEYCNTYKLKLSEPKIIGDLIKAKILCREGDSYRFTYRGCYCYLVARYFAENLSSNEAVLRQELNEVTDRLAWEDYTHIVMFFLYLTRDAQVIERLLANAARIYAECEPANLDSDVQFVNKLLKEKPKKLMLPSIDLEVNRDEYRGQQDEAENRVMPGNVNAPDQRVPYDADINELVKLAISFQTLKVMGQVLRNFPGVLTAGPKYRLAEASYLLGLRTLRRLLTIAETQLEQLRSAFGQIFKEAHPLATQEEMEISADQKLIWLTGAVAYGIIKKICRSIGLEDLELTFEQVRNNLGDKTSVRLVDLAIQLEYFREAPEAEIHDQEKKLERNLLAYKLLRDLVSEFLLLYNTDTQVFQRLGRLFKIEARAPRFLLNKAVGVGSNK